MAARPAQRAVKKATGDYRPPVTVALIASCVAVFAWDVFAGGANVGRSGSIANDFALWAPAVKFDNEWYRVISAGFAHSGLIHLGFNMWLLWVLGGTLEKRFGALAFGTMYVTGLLGGSLGAMLVEPTSSVVGASGAVFGLMGVTLILQRMGGIGVFQSGIGMLVVFNVVLSFRSGVSLGGHLGGLAVGLAMGAALGWAKARGKQSETLAPIAFASIGFVALVLLIPVIDRAIEQF